MASWTAAIIAAVWCACLAQQARAQIRVMSPESLVSHFGDTRGRIDGSTATFGAPFYGERILGRLVWGEPHDKTNPHCTLDDYTVPPPDDVEVGGGKQQRLIHIVMVRRGGCSFVTKVKAAQVKGAHAVIIVDAASSSLSPHDIRRIIVADDGRGENIDIPSILVSAKEGESLIQAATGRSSQVIIELAWDIPTNPVVTMDLWMSSASKESMRFLRDFSKKRKELNHAIRFRPHFHVFGMEAGKDNGHLCTNSSAEYCAEVPDGPLVTGKDVLAEDVRQLCIHELYKITDPVDRTAVDYVTPWYAKEFWNYVEQLLESCPTDALHEDARFGRACSERLMRQVGIDVGKVQLCADTTTEEKLRQQRRDTAWSPRALRINGWRFHGALDADLVTRALCAGFVQQPPACAALVEPLNVFRIARGGNHDDEEEGGVSFSTFVLAVLTVAGVILGALLLYKRSLTRHIHSALREEVMLEVQAQMDSYKQLPS